MLTRLLFLLITTFVYSQQKIYYHYGYDGIERIGKIKDSTVIYTNFNARPEVRMEVADYILKRYNKLKPGKLEIKLKSTKITGRLDLIKVDKLVTINYYYEKVEYGDTLILIYKKPIKLKKRVKRK